ncbi:MAG: DUF3726 domain-containing protein [Roseovarius sp.]|uniref:DUF3726 domain-containing protein n=1 Tax=Roseovarius sp. TaxID=1486281 RepID=UPI00405820B7
MLPPNDPTRSASAPDGHQTATVRLSLSEINALCFKAARGAGLGWGEAEEAGWAAAWLSRAGFAGPEIILGWLADAATLARPAPSPGRWAARARAHCPLRTGAALADFAGLPEGPGAETLIVEHVAHPLVTLPFVARAAGRLDLGLSIGWAGFDVVLNATGRMSAFAMPGRDHRAPTIITIAPKHDPAPPDAARHHETATVAGVALGDWQALDALALRITVPPSPQSRAGAGAAGDDND